MRVSEVPARESVQDRARLSPPSHVRRMEPSSIGHRDKLTLVPHPAARSSAFPEHLLRGFRPSVRDAEQRLLYLES